MRTYLNRGWHFIKEFTEELINNRVYLTELEEVSIPHTCKETPFHYFDESEYQMVCGYQIWIHMPESLKGKTVLLTFEGVAHSCEVYLNGNVIGSHHCGYTAFTLNLSNVIRFGEDNLLVVKVDSRESQNIPPFGHVVDYMTYGGIYRDVYLEIKEPYYLKDVFLHSDTKVLTAEVTLNDFTEGITAQFSLSKKDKNIFIPLGKATVSKKEMICKFPVTNVTLWDVDNPALYEVKVELVKDGNILDESVTNFGFRTAEFKKDGFYLNGRKLKILGLNRHQSYPYVGYAMPESMQKLDADLLKYQLGCNAVRTSHYPQSHYFVERCDEIGLMVFTEIPGWQHIGDEAWKEQACKNVEDMVLQYRNHPSIILWGVRINESPDDDEFYKRTNEIAHRLDPSRQTGGVRCNKKSHLFEDVYTYNDFIHSGENEGCELKKSVTSDVEKPYLVTEYNGHMFPTKSYDCEWHRMHHAMRHANVLDAIAEEQDIAGSFGWCMFDYNTHQDFGSGDRVCYHGVLDMFRNPKMAAYVYGSQQDLIPVLETSSGMEIGEYPASTLGTSYIFTNADSVRMYKNGKFIKEYTRKDTEYKYLNHGPISVDDLVGDLLIPEEGFSKDQSEAVKYILNAVAKYGLSDIPKSAYLRMPKLMAKYHMTVQQVTDLYTKYIGNWGEAATQYRFDAIKDGHVVRSVVKAPMKSITLHAEADHVHLVENHTYDVALVQIKMVSEHGNVVSFSNEPIFLDTIGPIEIIGPKCFTLQGGMFGTYVKTTGASGPANLIVRDMRGNRVVVDFEITAMRRN